MTDRPILFSGEMVRAILDGRKTQTRRVMKPQPSFNSGGPILDYGGGELDYVEPHWVFPKTCKYGKEGDLLCLRETWRVAAWKECGHIAVDYRASPENVRTPWVTVPDDQWCRLWQQSSDDARRAGEAGLGSTRRDGDGWKWDRGDSPCRWRPSIYMPRWASRITLRITDIRVERLQDITEDDARAEGCDPVVHPDGAVDCGTRKTTFASLWNKINGPGAWDANPWVWVVSFERVKP